MAQIGDSDHFYYAGINMNNILGANEVVLDWAYEYGQDVRSNSIGWRSVAKLMGAGLPSVVEKRGSAQMINMTAFLANFGK